MLKVLPPQQLDGHHMPVHVHVFIFLINCATIVLIIFILHLDIIFKSVFLKSCSKWFNVAELIFLLILLLVVPQ